MKISIVNIFYLIAGFFIGISVANIKSCVTSNKGDDKTTITHAIVVDKIESLGKLEVMKYSIQDIIEYKKERQWLPNAKAALQIKGEVIVCLDLNIISDDMIKISGDSIALILPSPEICHTRIDHSLSKVYDMQYGFWETATLVDEAYTEAQREIEQQAKRLNLKTEARDNSEKIIRPMLQTLGFNHITIFYNDDFQAD